MSEEKQERDLNDLTEGVSELQKEVRLIKNGIKEIGLRTLIDKLQLFIENTEEQFEDVKQNISNQQQEIEKLKQSIPRKTSRSPSEYQQLHNMLQAAKQSDSNLNPRNRSNTFPPAKVEITSIHSGKRRSKE